MENFGNKIDAYIEENCGSYNIYFHYNDVEFVFLHRDNHARNFAINFKWKYLNSNVKIVEHTFTDDHGFVKDKKEYFTVLSSIKGIKNIDDSIVGLVVACVHPEINSDLTIHLNSKEYPIVRDVDRKEYFPADILKTGVKGISVEHLHEITKDINQIKHANKSNQYKKTNA